MDADCIFCKIAHKTIPAKLIYEDELIVVFPDLHPQSPVHLLAIPKAHIASLADARPEHEPALGRMLAIADKIAAENGSPDGCRLIINDRKIGRQEVFHVHMHILGGNQPLGRMLPRD